MVAADLSPLLVLNCIYFYMVHIFHFSKNLGMCCKMILISAGPEKFQQPGTGIKPGPLDLKANHSSTSL